MNVEQLLLVNSNLKRRLNNNLFDKNPVLYDALGKRIDAQFIATDILRVCLPDSTRLHDKNKPYCIDLDGTNGRQFLGENEAKVLLGYDYLTKADVWDVPAMLEACEGGMGGARTNAYCLGGTHTKGINYAEIPVAFFIIPKKDHKRLVLNPEDTRFKEAVESLKAVA